MPVNSCPDRQEYQRLVLGQLTSTEVERLTLHLEQCGPCVQTVQQLKADDALLLAVRGAHAAAADLPRGQVVDGLIERLSQLRVPVAVPGKLATVSDAPHSMPSLELTTEQYDFLAPPQGPGERGRLGGYRVLKVLGAGGMGVVFQAEDPQLKRLVALKAMKPALAASDTARQRFLREAQATAALKHDHIVTIYQVGEDRGVPFLAMELLQGEPLDHWLERGRKPTIPQVLRMGREIARGLRAAHEVGLIHRDIKPGNIWLEAPTGRVKILDFGLARSTDDNVHLTQSGMVLGTPAFMSPEQANAKPVDPRSDLFSLGSVLYRLLAGQLPFNGTDAMSLLFAVAMGDARPLREVNPAVPPELADLVMQLLAREPADRPQSAKVVVETLQRIERSLASSGQPTASPAGAIPIALPVSAEVSPFQELTEVSSKIVQPPSQPARGRGGRRLPWKIAAAVVLLGVIGVFAAPIVIRIKDKDGRETKIEVPEGSSVSIEKDGKVIAKVPPQAATIPAAGKPPHLPHWVEQKWIEEVSKLPPQEQVKVVTAKLKERNPGFDGKLTHAIEKGAVTVIRFPTDEIVDISPLRALPSLEELDLHVPQPWKNPAGKLADLTPLQGMKITSLNLTKCGPVQDLTPLHGMPLTKLQLSRCQQVHDLAPLKGIRLTYLDLNFCVKVQDLTPLHGMPLTSLSVAFCKVRDLTPLKGMKLTYLNVTTIPADLTPLDGMPLEEFHSSPKTITKGIEVIRRMKSLKIIGVARGSGHGNNERFPAPEFWQKYDAGEFNK